MSQFVFRIHGEFCEELVVCDNGLIFNRISYRGKYFYKHFILSVLVLFGISAFIDYSVHIYWTPIMSQDLDVW